MKKIAIVYMAHDGFTSLYTGVGTIARDFLLSFPQVSKNLKNKFIGYNFDFYATTIKYNKNCFGFSEEIKRNTLNFISKNKNTHLIELLNGSKADQSYGTIDYWKFASISGATFIYTLSLQYDQVIVITVDTPFTQVANYFFDQYNNKNVNIIWLPQSTVRIHKVGISALTSHKGNKYEEERYKWEKGVVELSGVNDQVLIGYVGDFMKKHLIRDYNAKPARLVSIKNSLNLARLKSNTISQNKIKKLLKGMGVPTDRPILFSFGRAEPYKGLDLVLINSYNLIKEKNYFVFIFCCPYFEKDPYLEKLRQSERTHKNDIKIISTLDFLLPHYIMQWQNTNILTILSRAEPFGLIPIESRFYNNENLTLLVSDVGGLREQVLDGIDGFVTKLENKAIRDTLNKIAELSTEEKSIISNKGYNKIISTFDQTKINTEFISTILSS